MTRAIHYATGEAMVAAGKLRRIVDDAGRHIGYQPASAAPEPKPSERLDAASITRAEIEANAGLRGKSRTRGLPERLRTERVHPKSGRLMPEEDFVERAQRKVEAWPLPANRVGTVDGKPIFGDRAARVYPRTATKAATNSEGSGDAS